MGDVVMWAALLGRDIKVLGRQWGELAQLWSMPGLYAFVASFLDVTHALPAAVLLVVLLLWPVQALAMRLWADDIANGVVEQIALSHTPLILVAGLRITLMAEVVIFPAALGTMIALMLGAAAAFSWGDVLSVFLAIYALAAVTSVIAALTAGRRGQAALALLLALPLLLSLLITLAAALSNPEQAVAARYLLAAASIVAIPLGAWATAAALRQQLSA